MLKESTSRYFRKHKDVTINFVDGLNIIKAGNEFGKSTLLESIGYNCFGSGALREPLKEVVSNPKWAEWLDKEVPVTKLFTQTIWEFGGVTYRVIRSSKGAEVYLNDGEAPKVTGQKEVTAYMENLFGIPAGKASALVIAEQGDIRGILSKGAADTSKFIEDLANFSEVDALVGKVQAGISSGSNQSESDRLELAEEALKGLEMVQEPDGASLVLGQDLLNDEKLGYQTELKELNKKIADAQSIIDANEVNSALRQGFEMQISSADSSIAALGEKPVKLELLIDFDAYERCCDGADHNSTIILKAQADLEKYKLFQELPAYADEWDEPLASLEAEIGKEGAKLAATLEAIRFCEDQFIVEGSRRIAGDTCPTCGTIPDPVEVKRRDGEITEKQSKLTAEIANLNGDKEEVESYLSTLNEILSVHNCIKLFAEHNPDHCELGADVKVPVDIKFKGWTDQPVELIDELQHFNGEIAKYDKLKLQLEKNEKAISDYEKASIGFGASKLAAENALKKVPVAKDLVDIASEKLQVEAVEQLISDNSLALTNLESDFAAATVKFDAYCKNLDRLTSEVAASKKALESKNLANLLLKDIRNARNTVTNKIWNTMLKVVSNYFTKMRGELSHVTRGEKNFLVNGKSTKGLSGSTLDVLGLAFRMAQSELFLAGVPFLALDEPFSGCDSDRSSSITGLLGAAVDKQVVLVTHSDIGPDVCENLITLEG